MPPHLSVVNPLSKTFSFFGFQMRTVNGLSPNSDLSSGESYFASRAQAFHFTSCPGR
jgi:hypothetical protein